MYATVITGLFSMAIHLNSAEENYRATCLQPHSIKKTLPLLIPAEELGISLHELKETQASS